MSRDIERAGRPAPAILITGSNPYKLAELVKRETARKSIVVRDAIGEVEPGLWGVHVYQVAPLERRWVKPVAIGTGVLAGLGVFGAVVVAAFQAAMAAAAGISVATVLGVLVVLAVVSRLARGGGSTTVDVRVKVKR